MAFSVSLEVESCKYEVFEGGVGVLVLINQEI